jgi:multidrug efflux pump subunit AcrA (membrane-fusion protein)
MTQKSPQIKTAGPSILQRINRFIVRFPITSFLIVMLLLVALAFIGDGLRKPAITPESETTAATEVSTFEVGGTPTMTVQAKVEKSGIITLIAQTGGIVQKIKVQEGLAIKRGSTVLTLSSNYQGANAPALTRKISQVNYQFLVDNYQAQIDSLNRNKEIARKGEAQGSELRAINRQSIDDTKSLISLNEQILNSLDSQLKQLEATNINGVHQQDILSIQQAKSGVLGALTNLRSGLRNTEYLSNNDEEAAQIALLSKDATLAQLELQEKSLALNRDIAQLSLRLAQVSESLMYPASPVSGTVERIHVKPGQAVNPGTVLATIRGDQTSANAVALVSQSVATSVSKLKPSIFSHEQESYEILPKSISQEATDGALHSIIFSLPEALGSQLTNNSYIAVKLPMGGNPVVSLKPYIPLDAVYQGQGQASVNIIDSTTSQPTAKNVQITLGQVVGQYVEVEAGLQNGDLVIIDRHVVSGEAVTRKE